MTNAKTIPARLVKAATKVLAFVTFLVFVLPMTAVVLLGMLCCVPFGWAMDELDWGEWE